MKFADAHAHLYDPAFSQDIQEVIDRATQNGCIGIVNNATDMASAKEVIALAKKYPVCKVALGLYPIDGMNMSEHDRTTYYEFVKKQNICAIGEIGLDYVSASDEEKTRQKTVFIEQIKLAKKLQKPLICHSRKAETDVLAYILENSHPTLMHCFAGETLDALAAAKKGVYFSIPVRLLTSGHFKRLVKTLPLSQLMLETDSPYLNAGKERNEPANCLKTIHCIATIKEITPDSCAQILLSNYLRFFSL
jgi:TatD DNase family protein